ncbi:MAG: hypothetical protein JWO94_655 [Verrucomicrobiaceae bacterium]|nr:hypothetical protein [Verrucomicrobiaceae bacterium]
MNMISAALLLLTVGGLTTSAVLAFWWAGGDGQFNGLRQGAMSVFDADEVSEMETQSYDQHECH